MDAVDRKILAELQRDGRITVTDLAQRVQLSISRCQRRLRELERDGVIHGYRAVVDAAALGFGFEALVFAKLRLDTMDDFDRALVDVPNVVEAQRLFGSPDYLLRVVTADLASYQRLYEETLAKLPGVRGLTSTIVMKQVIEPRPLPANP
ncbi:DNA-binding transcriptional regulator, Lrp family [Lentzea waywayandensis]|uniref:DNA-binding transcriptional regulator, Lrp family n=1 Tax=Lentzea waywayandensis TaxID=84724 RepID=A0A1I6FB29_9PSEU|nr:Lrp/AsnC family transcriptional regulator [Lentzea waywayandensis]SFR27155.1 DNA-binding transcriptional regulator, Lrp family [Lentzea waywayandensis]